MFWLLLLVAVAVVVMRTWRSGVLWVQCVLQLFLLALLRLLWGANSIADYQGREWQAGLSSMALVFLAPFTVILRGKMKLPWAIAWSAAWIGAAIWGNLRIDTRGVYTHDIPFIIGFFAVIAAVGAGAASLLALCIRSFFGGSRS